MTISNDAHDTEEKSLFSLEEYDYLLPDELIAQEAIHPHHDAKVIVVDKRTGDIEKETTF